MGARREPQRAAVEAIKGRGKNGHQTVYRWMWEHWGEIHAQRAGRPDWVSATAALTELGFVSKDGRPLKPENVRKTWSRVVADREANKQSAAQPRESIFFQPDEAPAVRSDDFFKDIERIK